MEHEDQQVEQIKNFLREYGIWIGVGIVVGLGSLFGWRAYQASQVEAYQQRTDSYQQISSQLQNADEAGASSVEQQVAELEGSMHGVLARFQLAQQAVQNGDLEAAAMQLESAQQEASNPSVQALATIRLARVQLALGEYEQALATAGARLPESFKAQAEEIRGDIYLAQDNRSEARRAYQVAVDAGGAQSSPSLQMKFENLAGE